MILVRCPLTEHTDDTSVVYGISNISTANSRNGKQLELPLWRTHMKCAKFGRLTQLSNYEVRFICIVNIRFNQAYATLNFRKATLCQKFAYYLVNYRGFL
jgi:hypothetical protein